MTTLFLIHRQFKLIRGQGWQVATSDRFDNHELASVVQDHMVHAYDYSSWNTIYCYYAISPAEYEREWGKMQCRD